MPNGRKPDTPEQRRYKLLRRRFDAYRVKHPAGVNRWIDATLWGYIKEMTTLARTIEAQGRPLPDVRPRRHRRG